MTAPLDRKWPVGLYAPGTYWCRCAKCGQSHIADKRAQHCADCTIQDLVAAIVALEALVKRAQAIIDPCYPQRSLDWQNEARAALAVKP